MPRKRTIFRWVMGLAYIGAGLNHFRVPEFYVSIMPPYLPWREGLVALSGVIEIALGAAALIPAATPWAAWGIIALLVAIFPANLHMALHPELFPQFEAWGLYARLPVQGLLIWWAWVYTKSR